jgi:hypothetical protein
MVWLLVEGRNRLAWRRFLPAALAPSVAVARTRTRELAFRADARGRSFGQERPSIVAYQPADALGREVPVEESEHRPECMVGLGEPEGHILELLSKE